MGHSPSRRVKIVPTTSVHEMDTAEVVTASGGAAMRSPAPRRPPLERIGRFLILDKLGEGGMGTVFAAYDPQLDRKVAIKVVKEPVGSSQERLLREAKALAQLSHPNVVPVFDAGTHEGVVYVAMEFVEGRTLGKLVSDDQPEWSEIVRLFVQAAHGLHAAHRHGLVHRDFKPDNVMVGNDGRVRVMDFGLVRGTESDAAVSDVYDVVDCNTPNAARPFMDDLTGVGRVMGTPRYMAPEQFMGKPVDHRTDLYAFSVALYEALLGQAPFKAKDLRKLAMAVIEGERRPLSDGALAKIPAWLYQIVLRGMSPLPADRWPELPVMIAALEQPPHRKRRQILTATGVGIAIAGTFLAGLLGGRSTTPPICEGATDEIARVWSEARGRALGDAYGDSASPYVADTLRIANGRLTAYAQAIATRSEKSCLGYHRDHALSDMAYDHERRCLSNATAALDHLAAELERGDPNIVDQADELFAVLPDVGACSRPQSDRNAYQLDDATLDAVSQVRVDLTELELRATGTSNLDVKPEWAALESRAEEIGYAPLSAELALARPRLFRGGDETRTFEEAMQALALATRADDPQLEAQALINLVGEDVTGNAEQAFARRHAWEGLAWAKLQRISSDVPQPQLELALASQIVALESMAAKNDRALEYALRALELAQQIYDSPDPRIGSASYGVARVLMMRGDFEAAEPHIERTRREYALTLGERHPRMSHVLARLANAAAAAGDHERAMALATEAVEIREAAYGPNDTRTLELLPDLAIVLDEAGYPDRASEALTRYLDGRGERNGSRTVEGIQALNSLCFIEYRLGHLDAADSACRAAARHIDDIYPSVHTFRGGIALNQALIARAREDLDAAHDFDTYALAQMEGSVGPEHPVTAYAHIGLGDTAAARGRMREAQAAYARALEIRQKAQVPPEERGEAKCKLAGSLPPSQADRALELARDGLADLHDAPEMWDEVVRDCEDTTRKR